MDRDLNGKKVLVVRLSALGDVIRTIPSVLGLMGRFPQAEFHWLVEDSSAGLLRVLSGIHLIEISRKKMKSNHLGTKFSELKRVLTVIREHRFDLSIDFHGVMKSGLFPLMAGVPRRIGLEKGGSKEGHRYLINERLELPEVRISRYARNLALARFVAPGVEPVSPEFSLPEAERAKIMPLMTDRPVLLFPGTSDFGRYKRWPAHHWAWLFREVKERYPVRFLFGPNDGAYRDALEGELGGSVPELSGHSLPGLSLVLRHARLVVACDTGPMHLAAVLGVPLIAMMGPSDPVLAQPIQGKMILPQVPCAPCRKRKCKELICQTFTTPKRVLDEIVTMLGP